MPFNCILLLLLPLGVSSFNMPTTFTLDPLTGLVFVGQQTGEIFATRLNTSIPPTLVKVVPAFSFGWHGLTSLHVSPTHLYATYTADLGTGGSCGDDGFNASIRTPPSSVLGCPHYGVLVRWAYSSTTGALSADPPEQLISPNTICSQFGSNGIDQIIPAQTPDTFYISAGVVRCFHTPFPPTPLSSLIPPFFSGVLFSSTCAVTPPHPPSL